MAASFVPLNLSSLSSPSAPGSSSHRHLGESPAGHAAFQPLADVAKAGLTAHSTAPPSATTPCTAAPSVTFERDGTQITRIRVQCACGQVMELDCVY